MRRILAAIFITAGLAAMSVPLSIISTEIKRQMN